MQEDSFDRLFFFRDFRPDQRDLLRPLFTSCTNEAGDLVFEQDQPAEYLYLVLDGEVTVYFKPDDGPPLIVARVRPEGAVGWSAALGSSRYTSSAVCATPCQMLRVRGVDLRAFCEQHPETGTLVLERLAAGISERLRSTHNHVVALLEQGLNTGFNSQ